MTRAEIEELRGDILLRVNKLIPILYRIFEVNFALETDFDKRTIVKFVDYSKNFEDGLLESYIENIKQTELEALKKGYKILDKTQIYPLFSTTEKIRNLLSRKIEKHKIKSWGINAPVYNFALERIIDTIKRFPERPRIYFKDFEWENVQSTERELVVPGFTKTSLKFIEDEAKPLYKINEILNRFKHDCIEEDEINEYINVNAEIYGNIKSLTTHKLIINKVDRYVESSFPDSKTVINEIDSYFFGCTYSKDVLFLYINSYKNHVSWLIPCLLNDSERDRFNICSFFIKRILKHTEGEEFDFTPFVKWDKKYYIQRTIPPDSECVSNYLGIRLFVSKETETFIQVVDEVDPYVRITLYPFKFFENIKTQSDPLYSIKSWGD